MIAQLLREGPVVINVGIRDLAQSLESQQVPVVHVRWIPPRRLEPRLAKLLEELGG